MRLLPPLEGIGIKPGIFKTQGFGEHPEIYGQFGQKGHNGNDYGAPKSTPAIASHDGPVVFDEQKNPAGTFKGYGKFARITFDEDGFTWEVTYGHLERFEGVNRQVKAGDVIGYVDSTGFSTGNHLHFGLRKLLNGQVVDQNNGYSGSIDPEPYLHMDFYKIKGESTIVAFYLNKYYEIATKPEDYAYIKAKFGIPDQFLEIGRDVVDSKKGGQVIVGMTFVSA